MTITQPYADVISRLDDLAAQFDQAREHYTADAGTHNSLVLDEIARGAAHLRLVSSFIRQGIYTEEQAYDWITGAYQILIDIRRANLT